MKKITKLVQKFYSKSGGLAFLGFVLAATPAPADNKSVNLAPGNQFSGLENISLIGSVPVIIQVIMIVAALVALIFLIIGGIKWITSGGDKTAVEAARNTITSALIGLLIVFAAWAIIKLIEYFFGITVISGLTVPQLVTD